MAGEPFAGLFLGSMGRMRMVNPGDTCKAKGDGDRGNCSAARTAAHSRKRGNKKAAPEGGLVIVPVVL